MEVEAAFEIARTWESQARKCYAEPIDMDSDNFVKMMLVDGCFLVEFMIMNFHFPGTQTQISYTLFQAILSDLYRDLIMLENQLPFFILECLYDKCRSSGSLPFVVFTCTFCEWYTEAPSQLLDNVVLSTIKVNHLVHLLSFYYDFPMVAKGTDWIGKSRPPNATQLCEAGVKFQEAEVYKHIVDICFEDGVLKIPHLNIHDAFETYVRNLLAFEHYQVEDDERYVYGYVKFLDYLISTEKDVSILVKAGIITNNIGGNNEEISQLFNNLCKDLDITCNFGFYSDISEALHEYCKTREKRCHRWMVSLRRDYFNTPWAFISFLAATFLILLTLVQTLYSALSYSK